MHCMHAYQHPANSCKAEAFYRFPDSYCRRKRLHWIMKGFGFEEEGNQNLTEYQYS